MKVYDSNGEIIQPGDLVYYRAIRSGSYIYLCVKFEENNSTNHSINMMAVSDLPWVDNQDNIFVDRIHSYIKDLEEGCSATYPNLTRVSK